MIRALPSLSRRKWGNVAVGISPIYTKRIDFPRNTIDKNAENSVDFRECSIW